jgi:hypothetical protein
VFSNVANHTGSSAAEYRQSGTGTVVSLRVAGFYVVSYLSTNAIFRVVHLPSTLLSLGTDSVVV